MPESRNLINSEIETYIAEARTLLPELPDKISFIFDKKLVIPGNGTGGTLLKPTVLAIGYDPNFDNKEKLSEHLRATVLHECYHAVQGWSDQNPRLIPETLLEDGVLEGAATVFERETSNTTPPWSVYEDDQTMQLWLSEIKAQKLNPNSNHYTHYKFGQVNGVNWMLYKLGTWINDMALAKNPKLSIIDFANKKPKEILKLAGI